MQEVITLQRLSILHPNAVLGVLKYKDWWCYTLERDWLNNQTDVSCIPQGNYTTKYSYSRKFNRKTVELLDVPNRTGIRIHSANLETQLKGCIALGYGLKFSKKSEPMLLESRKAVFDFETLWEKDNVISILD